MSWPVAMARFELHTPSSSSARIGTSGQSVPQSRHRRTRHPMTPTDPLRDSAWSAPETVAGFAAAPPNSYLLEVAESAQRAGGRRLVDVGCGAGRNAVPLAESGWTVLGIDLSLAMLEAAGRRRSDRGLDGRL